MEWRPTRRTLIKLVGAAGAASVARLGGFVPELQVFSAAPKSSHVVGPVKRDWDGLRLSGATELADAELHAVNRGIVGHADVTAIAGAHGVQLGHTARVVTHKVEGGGQLLVAAWELPSNRVLFFLGLDQAVDGIRSQALLVQVTDDWQATLVAQSVNGKLAQRHGSSSQASLPGVIQAEAGDPCGGCGCWGFCGNHSKTQCCTWDLKCVGNCCGACVLSCISPPACAACFALWCPFCMFILNSCCRNCTFCTACWA